VRSPGEPPPCPAQVAARRKSRPSRRSEASDFRHQEENYANETSVRCNHRNQHKVSCLSGRPTVWAEPSSPCKTQTATENTMVMQSPCSPTQVKANQTLNRSLLNVAITDAHATVHPEYGPRLITTAKVFRRRVDSLRPTGTH
jgi:hypothetical protein